MLDLQTCVFGCLPDDGTLVLKHVGLAPDMTFWAKSSRMSSCICLCNVTIFFMWFDGLSVISYSRMIVFSKAAALGHAIYTVCADVGCSGMCHHFASAASRSSPKANSKTGSHYTPSWSVQRRVDGCKSFCNSLHSFIGEIFLALWIYWKPICVKLVNILYAVWWYRHSNHTTFTVGPVDLNCKK